jgi:formate--tetrahydrofolate ligase
MVEEKCRELGVNVALSRVWAMGGAGASELSDEVLRLCSNENGFEEAYALDMSIREKIESIAKRIYRASDVSFTDNAKNKCSSWKNWGLEMCPYVWQRLNTVFRMI